jgi:F-type H+-transporting ATPase subunit delta
MKITANQYATTLLELTEGKSQEEIDKAVLNLVKVVRRNNQSKLFPRILENFNAIWNKKNRIIEAEIVSSKKLNETEKKEVEEYIKRKHKAETVMLSTKIDENIMGGFIIRVGDEILDASVSEQLKKLTKKLTK